MPAQLELRNFTLEAQRPLTHDVSLTLQRGRVLALVGGSGSGKSLTCAAALGVLPAGVRQTAGTLLADGQPISPQALRGLKVATIMQNPRSAFNPLRTMAAHARETCRALGKPADDATLIAALGDVGHRPDRQQEVDANRWVAQQSGLDGMEAVMDTGNDDHRIEAAEQQARQPAGMADKRAEDKRNAVAERATGRADQQQGDKAGDNHRQERSEDPRRWSAPDG